MKAFTETPDARAFASSLNSQTSVLVVDDEPQIRSLFLRILNTYFQEIHVTTASHGQEALSCFGFCYYSVVISDLHMPVMSGEEAFCRIQRYCKERNLPQPKFIFCTALDCGESIRDIVTQHPEHCLLVKPVSVSTFVNTVREVLCCHTAQVQTT